MLLRCVLLAMLMICAPGFACAQSITFNTEEWYPYSYTDEEGHLMGTAVEIVRAVVEKVGMNPIIAVNSRTRSYNRALSRDGNCVFPSPMVGKHRTRFKWISPIETNRWVIYKRKGKAISAQNMTDLKDKKLGGFIGSTVTSYIRSLGHDIKLLPRDEDGLGKLDDGTIDLWATTEFIALTLSKTQGVEIEEVLGVRDNILGIACNLGIDVAMLAKLQSALDEINSSEEGNQIRQSKF